MFMLNFSFLASTQSNLDKFLTIFEENSRSTRVCNFILNLAKHVHAKFQLSSFYPDGLRQIFTIFQENIRIFQKT
jgi:hypothetical protein